MSHWQSQVLCTPTARWVIERYFAGCAQPKNMPGEPGRERIAQPQRADAWSKHGPWLVTHVQAGARP